MFGLLMLSRKGGKKGKSWDCYQFIVISSIYKSLYLRTWWIFFTLSIAVWRNKLTYWTDADCFKMLTCSWKSWHLLKINITRLLLN
jgi:hypothetical protein